MVFVLRLPIFPKFCSEEDVNFETRISGIGAKVKMMNQTEPNFRKSALKSVVDNLL